MRIWIVRAVVMLIIVLIVVGLSSGRIAAQETHRWTETPSGLTWKRSYHLGDTLTYEMQGSNQGWTYQIQANALVKQDKAGAFYEEIGWSNLRSNAPMTLSPSSLAFRQTLSLDGTGKYIAIPDLSKVQPFLIGPITDTLTFYSDLLLARKLGLTRVGQHIYFKHSTPNSWADGNYIVLGQDAIDFDFTLLSVDSRAHTATLLVRHVPPKQSHIKLPAQWMMVPVADTPNNWVEVEKSGDKYIAEVGKETFEVRLVLDTRDGKLLSADLDNPVVAVSRTCADAALSVCEAPVPKTIQRNVRFRWVSK